MRTIITVRLNDEGVEFNIHPDSTIPTVGAFVRSNHPDCEGGYAMVTDVFHDICSLDALKPSQMITLFAKRMSGAVGAGQ